jgi:hypothetical protein
MNKQARPPESKAQRRVLCRLRPGFYRIMEVSLRKYSLKRAQ